MTAESGVIAGVVSCPNPPLLQPGVTGTPVAEVEQLRAACLAAITDLLNSGPDRILLIGGAPAGPDGREPLSLSIGRLLLAQASCGVPIEQLVVAADAPTAECLRLGRAALNALTGRTGVLVLADGSARRSTKAPGYLDERAAPFDASVLAALSSADPAGLAALDPALASELMVGGRAAWQVLAGLSEGVEFSALLYYADDPFGVWYPVLGWLPKVDADRAAGARATS